MALACSDLNQSVGKPFFLHLKLNDTDKKSIGNPREKNSQLPVAVRVSKTSVLKLPVLVASDLDRRARAKSVTRGKHGERSLSCVSSLSRAS